MPQLLEEFNKAFPNEWKEYINLSAPDRQRYLEEMIAYKEYAESTLIAMCAHFDLAELAEIILLDFYDSWRSLIFLVSVANPMLQWADLEVVTSEIVYVRVFYPFVKTLEVDPKNRQQLEGMLVRLANPQRPRTEFVKLLSAYTNYWGVKQPDDSITESN